MCFTDSLTLSSIESIRDIVSKLVGIFSEKQTDEQLIAAIQVCTNGEPGFGSSCINFILHGFYNRTITNLMFGLYNEAVIEKVIKKSEEILIMKVKRLFVLALAVVCSVSVFAGCEKQETGTVATDGSTSMEKVIGSLKETFEAENKGITVTYNPTGSGTGITAVAEGRCDIGLSSRALKDEEKSQGLVETTLALDGIAIIVNKENTVEDLSLDDIAKIYTGEITNWSEVGGEDADIVLIGREAGSGTRDGFESITGTSDSCKYRQELTSTGDVITTVSSNPGAIGYASLAAVKDTVKKVSVDGVEATEETVKDGSYKVQRPFVLVTKDGTELSEAAQAFFDYATSKDAADIISAAGAVPVAE